MPTVTHKGILKMKRNHRKSLPINIEKLIKSVGAEKAAISLGVTPNAVKNYVRNKAAPYATEVAAQSLCTSNSNAAIIHGDPELLSAVKKIMQLGNGRFVDI